ncbi:YicC/YloC family endoribonuclease [Litchfieldia salsa]|uniref:TIGR00255 family protein n=1 Tax=Litchfieldia salsa TaxID=930152 RepID=A0A1H0RC46_9BACI|nr:YicC/YloC family endoribonuclease [Litchfieldia salsa]SDP26960.1 TIGR00255 family protein [Litchfieldia salsa]
MIVSMTGFGRATESTAALSVTVEVKSVNHRFCEIQLRMPRQLMVIEDKIKKAVHEYVNRGRIELFLTVDGEGIVKRKVEIDWGLMDNYYELLTQVKGRYSLKEDVTIERLINLEGVTSIVEEETDYPELQSFILKAVHSAMDQLKEMREVEGKQLYNIIKEQILHIMNLVEQISLLAPTVIQNYRDRMIKKVSEYVSDTIDESKFITEVAIFAEKADINEEITRLKSHASQFIDTLQNSGAVGRKLDFIVQEMNREINTIGAKANDESISILVVDIKSLLEKVKEQVQNIE